jgi:hypothetical protein
MTNGFDHSPDLRLVGPFELSDDALALRAVQICEDAATFEGHAARNLSWSKRPGETVLPYDFDPNHGG